MESSLDPRPTTSPRRCAWTCGVGQVSWLEAAGLAFPSLMGSVAGSSWRSEEPSDLSQWRGRAGLAPASGMTHPPN